MAGNLRWRKVARSSSSALTFVCAPRRHKKWYQCAFRYRQTIRRRRTRSNRHSSCQARPSVKLLGTAPATVGVGKNICRPQLATSVWFRSRVIMADARRGGRGMRTKRIRTNSVHQLAPDPLCVPRSDCRLQRAESLASAQISTRTPSEHTRPS